jgi:hypothetical protein
LKLYIDLDGVLADFDKAERSQTDNHHEFTFKYNERGRMPSAAAHRGSGTRKTEAYDAKSKLDTWVRKASSREAEACAPGDMERATPKHMPLRPPSVL